MNFKNISAKALLPIFAVILFFGCKKPAIVEQAEGKGSTIIRATPEGGFKLVSLDLSTTSQTFAVLDVYRDANSEEALNSVTHVVITEDPTLLTTGYTALPSSSFMADPANPKVGNSYTLTFNPGEFYKQVKITIPNASLLDPNKKYGMGFKLSAVDNNGKISATSDQKVLVEVGLKNKWDGVYTVLSGFVQRYTAPGVPTVGDALNGSVAGQADLILTTVGANTIEITNLRWATPSTSTVAGIDNLRATIDPVTNEVTMFALGNSTLANWETKENRYDPLTKTFYLNFRWNPLTNRREYSIAIKYKGPR